MLDPIYIVNAPFQSTLCKSEIFMHQEILYSVWGRLTATVAMPTTMIAGRNFISNPGSAFTAPAVSPTSPVKSVQQCINIDSSGWPMR